MDDVMSAGASGAAVAVASEPLLRAADARIAVDDVVAIEKLSLETRGDRVLFVGEVDELFAALTAVPLGARGAPGFGVAGGSIAVSSARGRWASDGDLPGEARVVSGSLRVAGRSVAGGDHLAISGVAPLDPPLPAAWTAEQYVAWSAQLAGASAGAARELAPAALSRVGLGAARRRAVGSLSLPERRVLLLAHAVVMSPEVLIAEAPLSGLEGTAADFVMAAIAAATEGRRAILSGARLDPGTLEGVLSRNASDVVVLVGGGVALEGPPSELFSGSTVYGVLVRSNGEPLRGELAARGIELRGGPLRFSAALPEGATTHDILAAAHAAKAVLVELVPLL
jgi:ABC-2 type transport system ATP-binding protein